MPGEGRREAARSEIRMRNANMLRNARLRTKLIAGFIAVAFISVLIGFISVLSLRELARADQTLYEDDTAPIPALSHLAVTFQKLRVASRDLLAAKTALDKQKFQDEITELLHDLDRSVDAYGKRQLSPEDRKIFDDFVEDRKEYAGYLSQIVGAAKEGRPEEGWAILWSSGYGAMAKNVLGSVDQMEQIKWRVHAKRCSPMRRFRIMS
jgi:Four helix bundle sensory module for signal transduction